MKLLVRSLPALAVTVLLAASLGTPVLRAGTGPTAAPDYLYYPTCSWVTEAGLGQEVPFPISDGEGICQPIGSPSNIASCVFGLSAAGSSGGRFDLVFWDPIALVPEPTAIALRTLTFPATYLVFGVSRQDMLPPVITRALHNVAEPPPTHFAMEYRLNEDAASRSGGLILDDASSMPGALHIDASGVRTPIPGAHPVFHFMLCGGNYTLQAMRVVQCVSSTDATLDPLAYEYIQKFRVPATASLNWVELAIDQYSSTRYSGVSLVRIFDAQGQELPPDTYGSPLMSANFTPYWPGPQWDTHADLATSPTLYEDHDYWLVVTLERDYKLFSKTLAGSESPYFSTAIGGLFSRSVAGAAATPVAGRALSFRLIATPIGSVGVEASTLPRPEFELSASPNPTRGTSLVSWNGARGDLRFEVLDARGRRVSSGAAGIGESGRWAWSGTGDDGRTLPAGVYFVRARDGVGRNASVRVSLVR